MTPAPPRLRYRIALSSPPGIRPTEEVLLDGENVIAWVAGFGAALGFFDALNVIEDHAPEDTRRVQALQIGHANGWFVYMYPEPTSDPAPGPGTSL